MSDYSSLKVPELKKLLAGKGLPQTGNKADLIARLHEDDKKNASPAAQEEASEAAAEPAAKPAEAKEDEITYSDDETARKDSDKKKKPAAELADEPAPAPAPPAAGEAPADAHKATPDADKAAAAAAATASVTEAASFALGLSSTAADDELKKRVDRARRFGIEMDDEAKKLADRAKRFGIDDKEIATGLDAALPERSLKRGRGKVEGDGERSAKRQSRDRRNGGGGGDERRGARPRGREQGSVLDDPAERAKAERRAARFAAA